ncbi:Gldg family protein [Marinicella sp. W31]|uniref:Gldg family protein n=1 Tax=Marinicella sp. W31 TaxID=3023713 RepID=UPI003757E56E
MRVFIALVLLLAGVYALEKMAWSWPVTKAETAGLPTRALSVFSEQQQLSVEVYAAQQSALGRTVSRFLQPLLAQSSEISVEYIDPEANPALLRDNGVRMHGEIILRQDGKKRHLTNLSYEDLTNLLQSLNTDEDKWLVFLEGFDSRLVGSLENSGLSSALVELQKRGYPVARAVLSPGAIIPDNVKALILPAPRQTLDAESLSWLQQQLQKGVNIWWLQEPELINQQPQLDLMFDVQSPVSIEENPLILKSYPQHALNQAFDQPIQLTQAMSFETSAKPLWQTQQQQILAATQTFDNSRLLVTGDADFISNQFFYLAANQSMMFRIVDWLLGYDDRFRWVPETQDGTQIQLSRLEILTMAGLMLVLLPLMYLAMAIFRWLANRRKTS